MSVTRKTLLLLTATLAACDPAQPDATLEQAATITQAAPIAQERIDALARDITAAEAVRSVKRLQWAYGHYSEFGLWHDFADLFADTGVGHYVQGDLDREGIRALFLEQVGQGQLGLADGRIYPHISFSPVVTLAEDGEHANARFRILAMLGGYGGNATWFHGLYENAYVKERGVWKVNELSNAAQVTGSFTAGLSASAAPAFDMHFTPGQAGQVATVATTATDTLASLLARAQRLEDEAGIMNLQHQYTVHLDKHDWEALVLLFAEQGTLEVGQQGVYAGKASIRKALDQFGALGRPMDVDAHLLFQPYVSIAPDGQSAAMRVDQLGIESRQGGSAVWTQGIYENTYVKEAGEWRIQSLHYYPRLITDFGKGWAADAQPMPGPNAAYPADAPPTETFGIYPSFYLPAFHFDHPVTGRAPQYPDGSPAQATPRRFAMAPGPGAPASDATQAALAAAEALAQRALAYDAVENLVNAYAYYLDACLPAEAMALFAEGAQFQPVCPEGRQEGVLTLHHAMQPEIHIAPDGQSATVLSKLWVISATPGEDSYRGGLLHAQAALEGAQWKLTAAATEFHWSAVLPDGRPVGQ